MSGLRVLVTNITLAQRTGTEINVRDIAIGLLGRGHTPVVYTRDPGQVADDIRRATVPVVDDLARLAAPPDVIHGHHHPETMQALLHFPGVPAVFFSHDFVAWHDAAPRFPRILRYVAVDEANRDRLVLQHAIPADRVRVVLNAVDLARFRPRSPLPPRPARALVFSNYASDSTQLGAIRQACADAGMALDVVGAGTGTQSSVPETLLPHYDLVFAKGRCALEALAVGAAVVLCDYSGLGGMVTADDLDRMRRLNFGRRLLQAPLDPSLLAREIARYDARDAEEASRRIRAGAGLDEQLDVLEALYREVIAEQVTRPQDLVAEELALADYLDAWGPRFKDGPLRSLVDDHRERLEEADAERRHARAERERLAERLAAIERRCGELEGAAQARDRLAARLQDVFAEQRSLGEDLERARAEAAHLRATVDYVVGTATWRLRGVLLRSRALTAAYRALRGLTALPGRAQELARRAAPRSQGRNS